MAKSNYWEEEVLNVLRGQDITASANYYISLHTADPTDAGSGAEVTGGSYARVAVSGATGSWSAPSNASGLMEITNSNEIAFPTSTANWGTITHVGIWDAATGGNLIYHMSLTASRQVTTGTDVTFPSGTLAIREG